MANAGAPRLLTINVQKNHSSPAAMACPLGELPVALRGRYQRIHTAKKGQALAELVGTACAACGATLPPQTAIEVRRGLNVMECPSCGRILVHRSESSAAS